MTEETIRTTPDDYMSAKATAIKYKGNLLTALRERKMLMLCTIVDTAFITIKDNEIIFNVNNENDVPYLENKRELLEKVTLELMNGNYRLVFKFAPPKQKEEDFFSTLAQIVGAEKITKK